MNITQAVSLLSSFLTTSVVRDWSYDSGIVKLNQWDVACDTISILLPIVLLYCFIG